MGSTKTLLCVLLIIIVIAIGVKWDIYRWHTFQQVTHSNIGFWKWTLVFDSIR